MIPKRYDKFGTVKILTVSRKQWYKNFENPSKFIFIVHPLHIRNPNPNEKLGQLPYTGISRDRDSFFANILTGEHFNPMSCMGAGGLFGISVQKYNELRCFQQSRGLLEQFRRSTVKLTGDTRKIFVSNITVARRV